mmetsp:Transcript_6706/g.15207  ORF Transcript_6706/g.15207 Transcript_6706/m.15207 type:complete len:270 (+) Transcript_6706:1345-2154(+)
MPFARSFSRISPSPDASSSRPTSSKSPASVIKTTNTPCCSHSEGNCKPRVSHAMPRRTTCVGVSSMFLPALRPVVHSALQRQSPKPLPGLPSRSSGTGLPGLLLTDFCEIIETTRCMVPCEASATACVAFEKELKSLHGYERIWQSCFASALNLGFCSTTNISTGACTSSAPCSRRTIFRNPRRSSLSSSFTSSSALSDCSAALSLPVTTSNSARCWAKRCACHLLWVRRHLELNTTRIVCLPSCPSTLAISALMASFSSPLLPKRASQ